MFLAVPRSDEHVGFERPFFARPMGRQILLVGRLERTGAQKELCLLLKTCLILILQKRAWEQFIHHTLSMIFQKNYFSCYILLTDQISSSDCPYTFRYWAICVLQLFVAQQMQGRRKVLDFGVVKSIKDIYHSHKLKIAQGHRKCYKPIKWVLG